MKTFILSLALLLSVNVSQASQVMRYFQEAKFPNQALLNKHTILNPLVASSAYVATALAGPTSAAATTVTTGLTSPDVPRNLYITPDGATGAVGTCTITVTGTDILGATITEDFAFAENASSATTGAKAFKTVTSVAFAANCEDTSFAAQWYIGQGEKLGLNRCMDYAGNVVFATASGVYESTRPTAVASASAVSGNTVDVNATMDGSADFEIFFVQNYRCSP